MKYALRIAALIVVLLVAHMIGAVVAGVSGDGGGASGPAQVESDAQTQAAEALRLLLAVAIMCVLETVVLVYAIAGARWGGWKLVGSVFLLVFGILSVQPQIEVAFFGVLPWQTIARILVMGAVVAAVFAPLAVLILGRWTSPQQEDTGTRPRLSVAQWGLRLGGTAVFYVVLYTAFGHFIAWQSPEVREFYGGASGDGGLDELGLIVIPWLGPFQAFRGLLWAALGLLVIFMMAGRWWEKGLAIGLLFAVLMNAQLLLPNPHMPASIRMIHLVETASSNFILGWWIAWLFRGLSRVPR